MVLAVCKFIFAMMNSMLLFVTQINQVILAFSSIRVNCAFKVALEQVRNYFCVSPPITFKQPEYDGFATDCSATSFPFNPPGSKRLSSAFISPGNGDYRLYTSAILFSYVRANTD
jgi:hypothetical protein